MTLKINENKNNINGIKNDITLNLSKFDNLEKYLVSSNGFNKVYNIEKQILKFNKDTHFFRLIEIEIEHDFTIDSLLIITNHLYYKYDNLKNDYFRCQNEYNIYNEDNLIHTYIFNHDKYYDENLDNVLYTNEDFCIRFKNNYKKIKTILDLHRHNRHGVGNIDLEIDDNSTNYLNIDYLDKNNENKEKIESNLGKIDINTYNISSNLGKIDTNKNNIEKLNNNIILKNIKNILFYSVRAQIDFKNNFYNKTFDLNIKKNDFIEINLRMLLDYENINESYISVTEFKLYDDNNSELLTVTFNNNDYISFSNFVL